jgi:succinoglycan biosynthesis transport protein ExoP
VSVKKRQGRNNRESGQVRAQQLATGVSDLTLRRILQHDASFNLYSSIDSELFLSLGAQRPLAFIVASARAREGRTTIATLFAGLSAAYREAGNVLLIDSDVRSNDFLQHFGGSGNQPGLYEFLRGDADLSQCLCKAPISNLNFMGGCAAADPRNKLDYVEFSECITELSKIFDCVVVDTRPAGDNPDFRAIARSVGSALVVVEFGATYRQQARGLVDSLADVDARVLGVVLNKRLFPVPRFFYGR